MHETLRVWSDCQRIQRQISNTIDQIYHGAQSAPTVNSKANWCSVYIVCTDKWRYTVMLLYANLELLEVSSYLAVLCLFFPFFITSKIYLRKVGPILTWLFDESSTLSLLLAVHFSKWLIMAKPCAQNPEWILHTPTPLPLKYLLQT